MVLCPAVAVGVKEVPDQLFPFGVGQVHFGDEDRCELDLGFAFHGFRNGDCDVPAATDRHCLVAGHIPGGAVDPVGSATPPHAPAGGVIPEGCGVVAVTSKALVTAAF